MSTTTHHIDHWLDGGDTKIENLVLLCRYHHYLICECRCGAPAWRTGRLGAGDLDVAQL